MSFFVCSLVGSLLRPTETRGSWPLRLDENADRVVGQTLGRGQSGHGARPAVLRAAQLA